MEETTTDTAKAYRRRDPMARNLEGTGLEGYREIEEVATRFNRSTKTIRRWCLQGLRHIKVGNAVFIADADIKDFFERNAVGGNLPKARRA